MPTSYTTSLGLALPADSELTGTWGQTVNAFITNYLDSAIAGAQTISGTQTAVTLSRTTGATLAQAGVTATGSSQYSIINCTGNPASLLTVTVPASSKVYLVINTTTTNQQVKIVGVGPTAGVTLDAGERALIAWNGSDFVKVAFSPSFTQNQILYGSATGGFAQSSGLTFDGANLVTTGTASATKLIPTGGTATGNGMYLPAANNVAVSTNGVEAFRVDSSGKLGIGTSSPAYRLDVQDAAVRIRSVSAYSGLLLSSQDPNASTRNWLIAANWNTFGDFALVQSNAQNGDPVSAGTTRLNIDASGNLGIGVSPGVQSTGGCLALGTGKFIHNNTFGRLWVQPGQAIGTATYAGLYGVATTYNAKYDGGWKSIGGGTASAITIDEGIFSFSSSQAVGSADAALTWTTRVVVDSSGNLGVGTASPTSTLHVSGSFSRGVPVTKTANFTLANNENWIKTLQIANLIVTLPTPSSCPGREVTIQNCVSFFVSSSVSNIVQLGTNVTSTTILTNVQGKWATIVSDGTNWVIMAAN
jgi:hypothetical protein